jgi:hypothetical protein
MKKNIDIEGLMLFCLVSKPCHFAMIGSREPFNCIQHPCYTKVFQHLQMLWMGIWMHTHTFTTTDVIPDLEELDEILGVM